MPENPQLYASFTALSATEPELLQIEFFYIVGVGILHIFGGKIMDNIIFPINMAKLMQMMPKHIFWPIIDCSSLYATGVTLIQGVVLRRVGDCGHFWSRDKGGGCTIRSAMAENPRYMQTSRLYLLQNWSYCQLNYYIAGIGNYAYYCKK